MKSWYNVTEHKVNDFVGKGDKDGFIKEKDALGAGMAEPFPKRGKIYRSKKVRPHISSGKEAGPFYSGKTQRNSERGFLQGVSGDF